MKGSVFKRCGCRRSDGRKLGRGCPNLKRPGHGSWNYAVEVEPTHNGKRRVVARAGFATRRDAEHALAATIDQVCRPEHHVVSTKRTVGEFLESWFDGKVGLRSSTRRSYRQHLDDHLLPLLGHVRLRDLSPDDVEHAYATIRAGNRARTRPIGPATMRRIHATLRSALNSAVKRRVMPFNPALHVELETAKRPKAVVWTAARVAAWRAGGPRPAVAVWTPEQTGAFLDCTLPDRFYPLFHLIAFRGLRRGEAVGLPWVDLDLDRGLLTVSQQVVQLGWATEISEPKTQGSERTIPLDRATTEVLREHEARQQEERRRWGNAYIESGLVFTREDGRGLHPGSVTARFERLVKAADLPPIRLHDLRHGAATLALAGGVPLKVVQEMLGHSSVTITADTYTSVLPEVAREAAERVAAMVPRAPAIKIPSTSQAPEASDGVVADQTETRGQVRRGAPPGT